MLIVRVAAEDRMAFDRLYAETSGRLFAVALRVTKDRAEAEDILQEAFVRIWKRAETFKQGQSSGMSWLVTIARNLAIDKIRARKAPVAPIEQAESIPTLDPTPEDAALQSDMRAQIDACLDELDDRKADAVRAAYVEGWSYAELAEHFGTPLNTIRTWLRRSLIQLRSCLGRTPS
jgi:RNA polymerase sigma-70 factor (ECF subfamily)